MCLRNQKTMLYIISITTAKNSAVIIFFFWIRIFHSHKGKIIKLLFMLIVMKIIMIMIMIYLLLL